MAITKIEGFKVYLNLNGTKSIIINSDCIDECMRIYSKNHLDGIAITTSHDYKLKNIDFLLKYPDIKHISISDGIEDVSAVHKLQNLESLIISGKNKEIDFTHFPLLINLSTDWSSRFSNIDKCKYLSHLSLYNYSPKTKDCLSIADIPWIKKLEIIQSSIHTLNGLENFNQLEELKFGYCSKLEMVCCLEKSKETLVSLLFDHCKLIKNHEYAIQFHHLNTLTYNDCGIIPSIKFIKKMTSLKDIRFVGTDIIDGDMTPCIGLKYAAFSNKKHFSHTMEEIKSLSNT